MNKKISIGIGILVITITLLGVDVIRAYKPTLSKEQLKERFSEFRIQYQEKKAQGYDVTEAEKFIRKAKRASDRKDYKMANKFLDDAFVALKNATPIFPVPTYFAWYYEGPIYQTHPQYYPNKSFKEITAQIPSLADLGIKTIFLMSIYESDATIVLITDYFKIDPRWGTPRELKELVDTAHQYDMRVIFDLVTCCTPKGSVIFNKGWTHSITLSELRRISQDLGFELTYTDVCPGPRPIHATCVGNDNYHLRGMITDTEIVKLLHWPVPYWQFAIDRNRPEVIDYFTSVALYYVKEYNIDGFRLDAPNLNMNSQIIPGDHTAGEIMKSVKLAITRIKPDVIFLAETEYTGWEQTSELLYGRDILSKLIRKRLNSEEFVNTIKDEKNRVYLMEKLRKYGVSIQQQKTLLVLVSTIPGVPMIQVGQELGLSEGSIVWEKGDYELRDFYKKVFNIRNSDNALKYGTIENVWKSGDNTYAYLREYKDEKVVVVINFNDKKSISTLDLSFLPKGQVLVDKMNGEKFNITEPSNFQISIPANGFRILIPER